MPALLLLKVQKVMLLTPAPTLKAPPPLPAMLPVKTLLVAVTVALLELLTTPPLPVVAVLFVNVQLVMLVELLPARLITPPVTAVFDVNVELESTTRLEPPVELITPPLAPEKYPVWARRGSYVVCRRLVQDVAAFWQFMQQAVEHMPGAPCEDPCCDIYPLSPEALT